MEFDLLVGKRRTTKAMKAGSARHEKLEQEVCVLGCFLSLHAEKHAWTFGTEPQTDTTSR